VSNTDGRVVMQALYFPDTPRDLRATVQQVQTPNHTLNPEPRSMWIHANSETAFQWLFLRWGVPLGPKSIRVVC